MERHYLDVPGSETHELPPLLVRSIPKDIRRDELVEHATSIVDIDDLDDAPSEVLDQRRLDLAVHLADQYLGLLRYWAWGDSVVEWIRQCEITFETTDPLRCLLRHDLWPRASRSSFVELLLEKEVPTAGVGLDRAVGTRLTFRQPPPIDCCSDQFLFFLNSRLAGTAYQTWAQLAPDSAAHFPPNRFHFEVHSLTVA
jgi:hypothetical protein